MPLKVGAKYRCKVHGVVGTAIEVKTDVPERDYSVPEEQLPIIIKVQDIARLALEEDHLEGVGDPLAPKAIDKRWYPETRLTEIENV